MLALAAFVLQLSPPQEEQWHCSDSVAALVSLRDAVEITAECSVTGTTRTRTPERIQ